MINLDRIILPEMSDKLKEEVENDVSEFELFLGDSNSKIEIVKSYEDIYIFELRVGYISQFKFPKGSKDNKFENEGPRKSRMGDTCVKISFNYNNKQYEIKGFV